MTEHEISSEDTRAADALLVLMHFREVNGMWLGPDGCRLDGGRTEALEEASAMVETEPELVLRVQDVVMDWEDR